MTEVPATNLVYVTIRIGGGAVAHQRVRRLPAAPSATNSMRPGNIRAFTVASLK
jgi:hypothetical protein